MQLEFKGIDKNNYEKCVELNVNKDQEDFVAPNWWSLLEEKYEDGEKHPLSIYDNGTMVGFIMYSFYPADDDYPLDSWWIERFMIDKEFQHKGYGKAALRKFLDYFRTLYGNIDLRITTVPENDVATKLYENLGFSKTGEIAGGEVVLHIKL
ncbi:GNAT family N-acetyltransferase [Paucisalibacillus sp. EB02]|uniref:GNAT family N-acetyltransferase n=1 Tax=Paucisalibacillus sp. EB02 TaxID=1347087 RepID=UPI0005A5EEF2|nr:GNAT family N-acetyltransferase [Paucisalibacillus sp. EB02]